MSQYIGGLKEEIRIELQLTNTKQLLTAMQLSKLYEAKFAALRKNYKGSSHGNKSNTSTEYTTGNIHIPSSSVDSGKKSSSYTAPTGSTGQDRPRISPTEIVRRKNLGLCFLCEDKWFKGHKCKEKKLFMLVADDEFSEEINKGEGKEDMLELTTESFSISLQALSGTTQHSTMRLRETVQGKPVTILVDSGSTHSFIDKHFSERLQLPSTTSGSFEVLVANGEKLQSEGVCKGVVIDCQGRKLQVSLLKLPITGCQIVLGAN